MRYLFGQESPLAGFLQLKSLPQQGIERLLRKLFNVCMLYCQVQAYIGQSFNGILFFGCEIQDEEVLGWAAHLLEETKGLVEVDRHSHLREVFTDRVFQDGPNADLHLRIFKERKFLSVWKGEWMGASRRLDDLTLFLFLLFKNRILKH